MLCQWKLWHSNFVIRLNVLSLWRHTFSSYNQSFSQLARGTHNVKVICIEVIHCFYWPSLPIDLKEMMMAIYPSYRRLKGWTMAKQSSLLVILNGRCQYLFLQQKFYHNLELKYGIHVVRPLSLFLYFQSIKH